MTLLKDYPLVATLNGNEKVLITDPDTTDPANNVLTSVIATYVATTISTVNGLSNVGNLGVGFAKAIVANIAQFNNIAPGSNKVSIALDVPNNNVLVDLNPSNISINSLGSTPLLVANGGTGTTTSTGTGSVVLSTSPTLTTPSFSTIVNTGTLTIPTSTDTLTGRATTDTLTNKSISGSSNTLTNISLTASVTGTLPVLNGGTGTTTSTGTGSVVLSASPTLTTPAFSSITNGGTLTLPSATDTILARATTDTLTNKSISGSTNTFTNISLTTAVTGTLPVANGGTGTTTSTGTGSVVLSTSPTLVTPVLGVSSSTSETITGTAGAGFLEVQTQSSAPASGAANSVRFFSNSSGQFAWKRATDGFVRALNSTLTADRVFTLQDSSDTFVMRSTTDTLTNKTISGASNTITNISLTTGVTGTLPVANGGTGVTTSTGTGSVVLSNSPTLVTPTIGAALATSINFGGSTLSTYVTGTFTPVLAFGGASVGITYGTQTGVYTRIGNIVHFQIRIILTSKGSSTGNATITGLPVTINASYSGSASTVSQNVNFLSTSNIIAFLTAGGTSVSLQNQLNNNPLTNYTDTQLSNTTDIMITGSYLA